MNISLSLPTNRPNFIEVTLGSTTLWFSYATLVGFNSGYVKMVRKNVWGRTTGKHLNYISADHEIRVEKDEFEAALRVALANTVL